MAAAFVVLDDIRLVLVSGSLLGDNTQAVVLASDGYDTPGGLAVTVTGWGTTYTDAPLPHILQKADISIVDPPTCQDMFASIDTVTERLVCAVCASGQRQHPGGHRLLGKPAIINRVRPQQPAATASRMQRLALLFVCLLGSAVALPARTRLWSRGNSRIIGGSNANIANYPWQLSFQYGGSHICGASIISSTWALTAAHCVDGMSLLLMTFRAGSSIRGSGGTVLRASSGYMHASYDSDTVDYDVAVVQVSGSLLGTNAQAVSLPSDGYDPAGGLAVTVTGWGSTYTNGPAPSNLQKLDISIVARSTCQSIFANVNTVTARMVCAGSAGQSVCSGDSGGPLVSGSTQVGIVSWGVSPCEASPGVYANVGNLRSWIRSAAGV
ncbi:trypsin delta-like [Schistocerca piceifrons]|uniref:trypsin delta-like n=2 Tax=Schistocerca piceifrons TaxID=274613 RepID=UPI001F5F7153|nr:trypsin delta-like [Schistocerca piceifrons]